MKKIISTCAILAISFAGTALATNMTTNSNIGSTKCELGQECNFQNGIAYYHVLQNTKQRNGTFICVYHNPEHTGKVSVKRGMAYYTGMKNLDFATELPNNKEIKIFVQKRVFNVNSEAQIKITDVGSKNDPYNTDYVVCSST